MTSISDMYFMMKYDFFKDDIPQYAKLRIITVSNDFYLVEDINTKNRAWVAYYNIYPLNSIAFDNYYWSYSQNFEEIAIRKKLK